MLTLENPKVTGTSLRENNYIYETMRTIEVVIIVDCGTVHRMHYRPAIISRYRVLSHVQNIGICACQNVF